MNSELVYRRLRMDEVPAALDLVWETFKAFRVADMSDEAMAFFEDAIVLEKHRARIEQGEMVFTGCLDGEKVVGVIVMGKQASFVELFFVDGDYHGRGIGRRLFEMAKAAAVAAGVKKIGVHSSPFAVAIYEALGFEQTGAINEDHGIRSYPMVATL